MFRPGKHLRLATVNGEPVALRDLRQLHEKVKDLPPRAVLLHVRDAAELAWFMNFYKLREQLKRLVPEGGKVPVQFCSYLEPKTMVIELSNGRVLFLTEKKQEPPKGSPS